MRAVPRFFAEPYRPLFTLGILEAVAAALVWPLHAAGWIAYPAALGSTK